MFELYIFFAGLAVGALINGVSYYYILFYSQYNDENIEPKAVSYRNLLPKVCLLEIYQQKKITKDAIIYLVIELITAFYTVYCVNRWGISVITLSALLFGYLLLISSIVDIFTQYLPDIPTYGLLVLGLVQAYFGIFTTIEMSIIGVVVGYGLLWGINAAFRLIRKKEGMGGGDFKLLAALLAWVGIEYIALILLIAPILSILVAVCNAIFRKKDIREPMAFGPFLAFAGLVSLLYGKEILSSYLSIYQLVI